MSDQTPAVLTRGLTHDFGQRRALDGIDLEVTTGAIVGLLGPNGGGKTTLFRILATLLRPDDGDASILGRSVVDDPAGVRRTLGVVFQSPSLDQKLTVSENLRHHGHLYGLTGAVLSRRRDAALEAVGIVERAKDLVETLSGGLQRRVELAKVLMHRPPVLLLDEPSTGLDLGARKDLFEQLESLRQAAATTILLTTHFMEEAERCDRVGILDQGSLVAYEEPRRLKARIGGDVLVVHCAEPSQLLERILERFGGENGSIAQVDTVDGTLRIEALNGHRLLNDVVDAFPGEITSASWGAPTLGDVFVHLTGHDLSDAPS